MIEHERKIVEANITHTCFWNTRCNVNMTNILPKAEQVRQKHVGSQAGSKSWRLLGGQIVDRRGNPPELDVRGIDVGKPDWSLFLDEVFEDADVVDVWNLDMTVNIRFRLSPRMEQLSESSCMGSTVWTTF